MSRLGFAFAWYERLGSLMLIIGLFFGAMVARADESKDKLSGVAKKRWQEMTSMIDQVSVFVVNDGKQAKAKRPDHALLRTIDNANTISTEDGSLWLWTHEGLPVALVELHARARSSRWGFAMLNATNQKIEADVGTRKWTPPEKSGVIFTEVPEADPPKDSVAIRKVQMRAIARRFTTNIVYREDRQQFRLLTEPIFRYKGNGIADGAIFAFVRGESNPEVLLFVEARDQKWTYGLLRCSSNKLIAKLDERQVWVAEQIPGWLGQPNEKFWVPYLTYRPSTK